MKWERMMGKVTLRRAGETCAQVLNTHKQADPHVTRGMGALSTGDTHTQQGCTQRTGMCTHNTHEGRPSHPAAPNTHEYTCAHGEVFRSTCHGLG